MSVVQVVIQVVDVFVKTSLFHALFDGPTNFQGSGALLFTGQFNDDINGVLAVSERALEVGMHFTSKQKFHECDVMLRCPDLNQYGMFDTKHHDEIFELGKRTTLAAMDSIKQALDAVT